MSTSLVEEVNSGGKYEVSKIYDQIPPISFALYGFLCGKTN